MLGNGRVLLVVKKSSVGKSLMCWDITKVGMEVL